MTPLEMMLALCLGVGLAAACGFRVFVPLLVTAVAARTGHLSVAANMQWIGSDPAIAALAVATVLEILAYYVPWVDNLLDTAATPAAVVAGTMVTAASITGLDPMMQWVLAAVAGGGAAATVQTVTVAARAASSTVTAGLGNPIVSTAEWTLAGVLSIVAVIAAPVVAAALIVAAILAVRWLWRRRQPVPAMPAPPAARSA